MSSTEALVATVNKKEESGTYFDKCRYCTQQHWSDECPNFRGIEELENKLKGSCFKCLRSGHTSSQCKRNTVCIHCNEDNAHHRSLCPRKFRLQLSNAHLSEESVTHKSDVSVTNADLPVQSTEICDMANGNMFITSGEMVLMQTTKTEVMNVSSSLKYNIRLVFDSGSQRTYVSKSLTYKLKLKAEREEEIKLVTFNNETPKVVKTYCTNLSIKLNNGKYFNMNANTVPVISGSVKRKKMDMSSLYHVPNFVKDVELADHITTHSESSAIDLLIGNDYYLDLILGQRVEIQPGLYLLAPKMGWIISGRTKEIERKESEPSLLILSNKSVNKFSDDIYILILLSLPLRT